MEWTQVLAEAPFSARSDTCAGVLSDGSIVIVGGHANSDYTNDVWRSAPGGDVSRWTQLIADGDAPFAGRAYHSCQVLDDDQLLLLGGHNADNWFNDIWVSGAGGAFDAASWSQVREEAEFPPRAAGSLVRTDDGGLFYMGGSEGLLPPAGSGATLYNDVWSSSDDGASWSEVTPAAPWEPREGITGGSGVTVGGSSLAVLGGEAGYFPWAFFGDSWVSTDGGANWKEREDKAEWAGYPSSGSLWNLKGRSGHIVARDPASETLWLAGGYLGRQDVWCLVAESADDLLTKPWRSVAEKAPWDGRYDHILAVVGDKLVMLAGENSALGFGGPYFNDVWVANLPNCSAF